MSDDDYLQKHLDLCQHIYKRMKRDGTWPWRDEEDSRNSGDVIESENLIDDA